MANCKTCLSGIKRNQLKLTCVDCNSDFHASCVKMTQADVDYLKEQESVWRCESCSSVRRKSMRLECSVQKGGVTLEDIMETLKGIQEEQRKTVADFNKSYEVLYERMEESAAKLQGTMEKIEGYVMEIDKLKSENVTLKGKVTSLETRVEDLENYSRRNCIEIQGVPEEGNENLLEVIKKVGNALQNEIKEEMIDACHRLGKKTDEKRPRGIIVKFVRRIDKEAVMKKRKRDFSTRHLGLPVDNPIYLNDSLSPSRRKLLGQVRQMRKDKHYKYLWLRNGNILLRKEEGSPVVEIRSQADLDRL